MSYAFSIVSFAQDLDRRFSHRPENKSCLLVWTAQTHPARGSFEPAGLAGMLTDRL